MSAALQPQTDALGATALGDEPFAPAPGAAGRTPSLLPPNATALQRALEQVEAARLDAISAANAGLWDPWRCPLAVLPWVAALHFSVDLWDDAWTESRKRAVAAASLEIHRRKGTRAAVDAAVRPLGIPAQIVEWFADAPARAPYTFRVVLPVLDGFDGADLPVLMRTIDAAKNLRSWLSRLTLTTARGAGIYVGAAARAQLRVRFPARAA